MVYLNANISMIALNVNGLNTSIKERLSEHIKNDKTTCCLQESLFNIEL